MSQRPVKQTIDIHLPEDLQVHKRPNLRGRTLSMEGLPQSQTNTAAQISSTLNFIRV